MNQTEIESPVAGLARLTRQVDPPADLWPGIHARLRPRRARGFPAWAGLALAASLLAAVVLPLQQAGSPGTPAGSPRVEGPVERVAYYTSQLKVVQGAETELLHALSLDPQSPSLQKLLESTRKRQRELRRLVTNIV